jgi:ribonuclease H-related protein
MLSQYEPQLRQKANQFAAAIHEQLSYEAQIDEKSFRDYSVAVQLGKVGKAIIYYSPKRKNFKLVTSGLAKNVVSIISPIWDSLDSQRNAISVLDEAKSDYQAFVDGSYNKRRKTVGYGAVILKQGKEVMRLSGRVDEYTESRQIGGELAATMQVINWCKQQGITTIDIFYDYKGIEMWATGRWKTEKEISRSYQSFMQKSAVKIHWHKVKSHTGVHWNDIADELAKQGTLS